jgi:hypothetical protein
MPVSLMKLWVQRGVPTGIRRAATARLFPASLTLKGYAWLSR